MSAALVITDGSLAALVAAASERDRGTSIIAWVPPSGTGLSEPGFSASDSGPTVRHQAAVLGYDLVLEHALTSDRADASLASPPGIDATLLLMEAARAAMANGCGRVIWPIALGDDPSAMTSADERAELINRLLLLDEETGAGRAVEITLPLVDLTPGQIDDLATDLGVPRHLCCEHAGPRVVVR